MKQRLIALIVAVVCLFLMLPSWIVTNDLAFSALTMPTYLANPSAYFGAEFVNFVTFFAGLLTFAGIVTTALLLLYVGMGLKGTKQSVKVGKAAFIMSAVTAFAAFVMVNGVRYVLVRQGAPEDIFYLTLWPYILFGLGLFMGFYYLPVAVPSANPITIKDKTLVVHLGEPAEKAEHTGSTLKRLLVMLGTYKGRLIGSIILLVLASVATSVAPYILGLCTDQLIGLYQNGQLVSEQYTIFIRLMVILVLLYVSYAVLQYISAMVMATATEKTIYDLRTRINQKMDRLPLNYYDTVPYGDILSRVTNDVDTVANALQTSISEIFNAVTCAIIMIIMMLRINPTLAMIAVIIVPLALGATLLITKKGEKFFVGQQEKIGDVNGFVEEMYSGQSVIAAYNRQETMQQGFGVINQSLYENSWKAQFIASILTPLTQAITNFGYAAAAVISAFMVISGQMSVGMIQSFLQYLSSFSEPITQTAQISGILQQTVAAAERIFAFLDETEEKPDSEELFPDNPDGQVGFEHVRFGYSPSRILVNDLHIDIAAGNKVGIVGPTGAGKTTMINLLLRFYEVSGGRITIDDIHIERMTRHDLRSLYGMVLQDAWLYAGTIRENIRYGRLDATDEDVQKAAEMANCDSFIDQLPGGYDFTLSEGGGNLAQGQKQLLTIARAVLSEPTILILDEATSSVDTRTEKSIQAAMTNLMKGRTSFVIAHRLSTIKDSAVILYMQDGDIREIGTHSELMTKNGLYANLYNSQFTTA